MENVTDALKMAASILIFVGALSLTIFSFSKARIASASVMQRSADNLNYYDNIKYTNQRIVGKDSVISNLYLYGKSNNTILFYTGNYDASTDTVTNMKPVDLYTTECNENRLARSILRDGDSRKIYGLDTSDEITRQEFWIYDIHVNKRFVDSLIYAKDTEPYVFSKATHFGNNILTGDKHIKIHFDYNFGGKNLMDTTGKFIERIGQYNYQSKAISSSTSTGREYMSQSDAQRVSNTSTAEITFDNQETIENEEGTKKSVIQYIYIGE